MREKTIGIVIFRHEDKGVKYLLLHHGGEYWNFPKGHQEGDENDLQTALRELEEETGIAKVKVVDNFLNEYQYDFDTDINDGVKEKIYKQAIFFLGEVIDQKVKISDEHIDFGWFDFDTALKRMFYQEGQNSLKKAHQFILKQQSFVL